ncbi:MAG: hypothetical protein CSA38_04540 [Flavobacteriales bacterium]|nr:MAG: hypothetical protein CSA38_04540 [Flavobacteriales bacterium]
MNKTVSIALAGFSFMIEEHAYIKLNDYLKALRNSLEPNEADEVMNDIEIRIVEILKDNTSKREVVNDADIEEVISRIGKPEEIEEQEEAYYSQGKSKATSTEKKQLFRDPERQKVAGVCAGLSHYLGLDMTLIRLVWVLGPIVLNIILETMGFKDNGVIPLALITYIILWIVLPKAKTASDFLKMKGEPLNFDNLKKESSKIIEFANESAEKVGKAYDKNKVIINQTGDSIGNIFRYFFGGIFAFIAISLILGLFSVLTYSSNNWNFVNNLDFFLDLSIYFKWVTIVFVVISVLVPILLFTYLAIKLLSPKTRLNYVGYVFGGLILLWIGLVIFLGFTAFDRFENTYSGTKTETENIAINTTSDSLILSKRNVDIPENYKAYWNHIFSDKKTVYKRKRHTYIEVIRKDNVKPYLVINKKASGYNKPLNMVVPIRIQDNKIELPNYIHYPYEHRLRNHRVHYELVVPTSTKIINEGEYIDVDDENEEDEGEEDEVKSDFKLNINGKKIEFSSDDEDHIIIDGEKLPKKEAEKILEKEDIDLDDIKNFNLNIDGEKGKISIETK